MVKQLAQGKIKSGGREPRQSEGHVLSHYTPPTKNPVFVKGYSKPFGDTQKHLLTKLSCTNKSRYSKKASTYTSLYLTDGFLSW